MAIPKVDKQNILAALKYIDENGVPAQNQSMKYELVIENGKKYPPKYVIAVARHLVTGEEISTEDFHAAEAKSYLQGQGFTVETKQEKFELTISAESITSTDERFTMDNLSLGDNYKPLGAFFRKENGEEIRRIYRKGEQRNSNQTLPRIACQVFEKQLATMSIESKENFPICKYNLSSETICGIYSSVDEFRAHRKTIEYLIYSYPGLSQYLHILPVCIYESESS